MIDEEKVIRIHKILIEKYGGCNQIRDKKLLQSALSRPFQTYDGKELYPSVEEKASAIVE